MPDVYSLSNWFNELIAKLQSDEWSSNLSDVFVETVFNGYDGD